ncbi:uncharacterized protein LOC121523489 [Cheilinus undulatus]|uniref:uncharacterized protein LOC121523489 n=1 Tax=Cheilinus undulatus TaxID=241271 RepID=UPI001BD5958E|nr:uncharacterized protein LOC121523489 [Cheilinus undulatus]
MSGFWDLSVFPVEVHQLSVSKVEVSPELLERSSSLNQEITEPPHIKEEPEELWSSQEGEHLQEPETADIIKFTFDPVPVKIEKDEEKPESSQLDQRQTEQMEREADGDNCGGPKEARYFDPERILQPEIEVKTEDSSEAETDDSADWRETTEHQTGLKWSTAGVVLDCCGGEGAELKDASQVPPFGGLPGTSSWVETSGKTQNVLEGWS